MGNHSATAWNKKGEVHYHEGTLAEMEEWIAEGERRGFPSYVLWNPENVPLREDHATNYPSSSAVFKGIKEGAW